MYRIPLNYCIFTFPSPPTPFRPKKNGSQQPHCENYPNEFVRMIILVLAFFHLHQHSIKTVVRKYVFHLCLQELEKKHPKSVPFVHFFFVLINEILHVGIIITFFALHCQREKFLFDISIFIFPLYACNSPFKFPSTVRHRQAAPFQEHIIFDSNQNTGKSACDFNNVRILFFFNFYLHVF